MATTSSGSSRTPSGDATTKLPSVKDDGARGSSRTGASSVGSPNPAVSRTAGAGKDTGATAEKKGPRRVRLTLARLDPFSVMKLSFVIAVAIGISTVVAVAVLWGVVDAIGLWGKFDQLGRDLNGGKPLPFMELFQFKNMLSYGTVIAFVNIVLITALGTLMAFLYNIVAALLGGLKVTFSDR